MTWRSIDLTDFGAKNTNEISYTISVCWCKSEGWAWDIWPNESLAFKPKRGPRQYSHEHYAEARKTKEDLKKQIEEILERNPRASFYISVKPISDCSEDVYYEVRELLEKILRAR